MMQNTEHRFSSQPWLCCRLCYGSPVCAIPSWPVYRPVSNDGVGNGEDLTGFTREQLTIAERLHNEAMPPAAAGNGDGRAQTSSLTDLTGRCLLYGRSPVWSLTRRNRCEGRKQPFSRAISSGTKQ